jgi:molybdopterin-binding protein
MNLNPSTTLRGTVQKIITSAVPSQTERVQIAVEGADHLYKELRIENKLTDASGNEVQLKAGAKVEITVQAEPLGVTAKGD